MKFNYVEEDMEISGEVISERATVQSLNLSPATWQYPDDCFYIKMYITAPVSLLKSVLGPCHSYADEKRMIEVNG